MQKSIRLPAVVDCDAAVSGVAATLRSRSLSRPYPYGTHTQDPALLALEDLINGHRRGLVDDLRHNWSTQVLGVPFSEEALTAIVEEVMPLIRAQVNEQFKRLLKMREGYVFFGHRMVHKTFIVFSSLGLLSTVAIPICLVGLLVPSSSIVLLSSMALAINLIALVFTGIRARNK